MLALIQCHISASIIIIIIIIIIRNRLQIFCFVLQINTALQLSLVAITLAAPVFSFVDHPALQALW